MNLRRLRLTIAIAIGIGAGSALATGAGREAVPPGYVGFADEQRIVLPGSNGDAMEPFIAPDDGQLLFNSSNAPGFDTNLFGANRLADGRFAKPRALDRFNSKVLDGVPSLDRNGVLYFVSLRSYAQSLSTLYRADFVGNAAPALVPGVSPQRAGIVQFDAEVAWDGRSLWISEGRFSGKPFPDSARIVLARKKGDGFASRAADAGLLSAVNQGALNYAASISRDGNELFFTRIRDLAHPQPVIMRAARRAPDKPFETPQPVAGIVGHVEAPSLSPDGLTLYYHKRIGKRFVLCQIRRERR